MPITYLQGDATDPQAKGPKVIAHIVNNRGGWGKGFVLAISRRWGLPEEQYREWYKSGRGFDLGESQIVQVRRDIWVANMLAQNGFKHGSGGPPIRYEALRECLLKVAPWVEEREATLHMPRIGTGLAGGTWSKVEPILRETVGHLNVYVYDYNP